MSVGIVNSEIFRTHNTGAEHSENYKRLDSINDFFKSKDLFKKVQNIPLRKILPEELHIIHSNDYEHHVIDFCNNGGGWIDEDTVTSKESYEVALNAAGSVLEAIDRVFAKEINKAFCMIRPPGHHALPDKSMGFCLFSNLALGAVYAMNKYKLDRILILDWDAHHGNGTEQIFYKSNKVFTVSWHQYPHWPFTGKHDEIGEGEGLGYNMNIPIPEGFTDEIFLETFDNLVVPLARKYKPQLILLAAGYDAHWKDHLAKLNVTTNAYAHLSKKVIDLAEELCGGKVVATLEGGYNLEALAESTYTTLNAMVYPEYLHKETYALEKNENRKHIKDLIDKIITIQPLLK